MSKRSKQNTPLLPTDVWTTIASFTDVSSLAKLLSVSAEIQKAIAHYFGKRENVEPLFSVIFGNNIPFLRFPTNTEYTRTFTLLLNAFVKHGVQCPVSNDSMPCLLRWSEAAMFPSENHRVLFTQLLLQDSRTVYYADETLISEVVTTALLHGSAELAKVFLDDKSIDISKINFMRVATNNKVENMKLLLDHPRVDNSKICTISQALGSKESNTEIVKMLLEDGSIDPARFDNSAIRHAVNAGFADIVELLLADKRVDPTKVNIIIAATEGKGDVVRLIVEDGRADPSKDDNRALVEACYLGYIAVVEALLSSPKVDPSARNNEPLKRAVGKKHSGIVQRLLKHERLRLSGEENENIRKSLRNKKLKSIQTIEKALVEHRKRI
jgi:hypothetical protein